MIRSIIKAILKPFEDALKKKSDNFLRDVSGLIHVGANYGQERKQYNSFDLNVLWIEPIPEVFIGLERNIREYPKQRAFKALITDIDGKEYKFYISNNIGASSSILKFKHHKDIWPDIIYTASITLTSLTLASLLTKEKIDVYNYQALVIDTQGSELLVLRGSVPILNNFLYIKTEVPDFESYEGGCQLDDIQVFMAEHGYEEFSRLKFAHRKKGGNYFDIVYKRIK